jgi:hypothetical protein
MTTTRTADEIYADIRTVRDEMPSVVLGNTPERLAYLEAARDAYVREERLWRELSSVISRDTDRPAWALTAIHGAGQGALEAQLRYEEYITDARIKLKAA